MSNRETPGKKKSKEVQLLVAMFFEEEYHARGELKTLDERDANYLIGVHRATEQVKDKWPLKIHKHGDPAPPSRTHMRRRQQREQHLEMLGLPAKSRSRGAAG